MIIRSILRLLAVALLGVAGTASLHAADEPDVIFKRSTVFKWLSPNDKLATYGLDDPEVDSDLAYNIAMHFAERELNLAPARKLKNGRAKTG